MLATAVAVPSGPQEVNQKVQLKDNDTSYIQKGRVENQQPQTIMKAGMASLPLPPYDPNIPIGQFPHMSVTATGNGSEHMTCLCAGVEHVKLGYYCRVCLLFYSNEDMAKKTHCSGETHYEKLQVRWLL